MGTRPSSSRTLVVVFSAIALLLVAVGSWAVGRTGDPAVRAHAELPALRPQPAASFSNRLDPAQRAETQFPELLLAELVLEIRLLREEIAGLRSSESTRSPMPVETFEGMEQLKRLVSTLETVARTTSSRHPLILPTETRRKEELWNLGQAFERANELDQDDEFIRRYLLWSGQDILDRFGIPDSIYVSDTSVMRWNYEYEDDRIEYDITFHIFDGRVIRMY